MKSTSQSGFAIAAVVGIVAVLALLGGTAYVTTHRSEMASSTNATSTDATTTPRGSFEMNANEKAQMNANAHATTSVGKDMSASSSVKAGAKATTSAGGININLGGSAGSSN